MADPARLTDDELADEIRAMEARRGEYPAAERRLAQLYELAQQRRSQYEAIERRFMAPLERVNAARMAAEGMKVKPPTFNEIWGTGWPSMATSVRKPDAVREADLRRLRFVERLGDPALAQIPSLSEEAGDYERAAHARATAAMEPYKGMLAMAASYPEGKRGQLQSAYDDYGVLGPEGPLAPIGSMFQVLPTTVYNTVRATQGNPIAAADQDTAMSAIMPFVGDSLPPGTDPRDSLGTTYDEWLKTAPDGQLESQAQSAQRLEDRKKAIRELQYRTRSNWMVPYSPGRRAQDRDMLSLSQAPFDGPAFFEEQGLPPLAGLLPDVLMDPMGQMYKIPSAVRKAGTTMQRLGRAADLARQDLQVPGALIGGGVLSRLLGDPNQDPLMLYEAKNRITP